MNTIQLLLSHATVRELHNCSRDIHFSESMGMHEYTRSPQDYWSNEFRLFLKNMYLLHILLTSKKGLHALSLTNAPYSCQSTWGKKAGNVISLI